MLAPGADDSLAEIQLQSPLELAIGPEGGFNEIELGLMDNQSVKRVGLGPRILRTETAGPAAVAVMQALAGDF